MARGLLILGVSAVLLLILAMVSGLASWGLHRGMGILAAGVGVGIPILALAILGWVDHRSDPVAPPKVRARLVPFAAWQAILLALTAWLGWSGAMDGPIGWSHGLFGGLSTGFALVAMVVAWASVVARTRALQGRRP